MKVEITEITKLQLEKVHFHSVRIGDNPAKDSEFKDFYNRMILTEKNKNDFAELMVFAKEIGTIYGAIDRKFVPEGKAERLGQPVKIITVKKPNSKGDYGLRLYCLRVDENNVILFNGDRKTVPKDVMECDNCRPYFLRANQLATIIQKGFDDGDLWIEDQFKIRVKEGFNLNLEIYGQGER